MAGYAQPEGSTLTCQEYYSQQMEQQHVCLTNNQNAVLVLSSITFLWIILTMVYLMLLIFRVYVELGRYRYQQHRAANINIRMLAVARGWTQAIITLCIIFFWFVDARSCATYLASTYGYTPFLVRVKLCVKAGRMDFFGCPCVPA